jgi:hypothetical protein
LLQRFLVVPVACLVAVLAVVSTPPKPAAADTFTTVWRVPNDDGGFDYHSGLYDVTTDEVLFDDGEYYGTATA